MRPDGMARLGVVLAVLLSAGLAGCAGGPAAVDANPGPMPAASEAGLKAQASLATTAHEAAKYVNARGASPDGEQAAFLEEATARWMAQTGKGELVPMTLEAARSEDAKVTEARQKEREVAAAASSNYEKAIAALKAENERLSQELKKLDVAAMWSKLGAIALVTVAGVAASIFWVNKAAPFVAFGGVGLAGVVVARACAVDLLVVGLVASGLAVLFVVTLLVIKLIKSNRMFNGLSAAVETLDDKLAEPVKAHISSMATAVGIEADLHANLVKRGLAKKQPTNPQTEKGTT